MDYDEIFSIYCDEIRRAGFPIHCHTKFCEHRITKIKHCKNCESEQGCMLIAKIMHNTFFWYRQFKKFPQHKVSIVDWIDKINMKLITKERNKKNYENSKQFGD